MNNVEKVYLYILKYKRANDGNSPSIREICDSTGIASTSQCRAYLGQLEHAGLIKIARKNTSRSIVVVGGQWNIQ